MNSYVNISIVGKNPKLFIKRYVLNQISFEDFKEVSHKHVTIKISYDDYLKLLSKNKTYEIYINQKYGIVKYTSYIKENYTFVISLIIGFLFLFLISNTILEIDVIHSNSSLRNLIYDELKDNNISCFRFIPSFKKRKKIINKIVNDNKYKIEWLEIERHGSKLTVKVTERKLNKEKEYDKPRHIVAKKDGVIMKIEASNGVILKKKNDYVSKGETIVSGDIIKDETVKGQVRAVGCVYAEVWYLVTIEYPLNYEEVIYLNDVKQNIIVSFMNREASLRKNYATNYLEHKNVLIKEKIFPFSVRMEKQRKTKVKKEKLGTKEAIKKATKLAENKISVNLKDDEYIISKKTLNFKQNESKIEVGVFFKVYENITDFKDADTSLLNKENTNEN